jgi:hypothetical protein
MPTGPGKTTFSAAAPVSAKGAPVDGITRRVLSSHEASLADLVSRMAALEARVAKLEAAVF